MPCVYTLFMTSKDDNYEAQDYIGAIGAFEIESPKAIQCRRTRTTLFSGPRSMWR